MELDCGLNSHSRYTGCMTLSEFLLLQNCKPYCEMTAAHQKCTRFPEYAVVTEKHLSRQELHFSEPCASR